MLCAGRPKRKLFTLFALGSVCFAGLAGAASPTSGGAVWFVAHMAAAQIFLAGVVTVRSAVWKLNYPREFRGQITARIQRIRSIGSVTAVLIAGGMLDHDPHSYRLIFPIAALFGLWGVRLSTFIRVRGERPGAAGLRQASGEGRSRGGWTEPFALSSLLSPAQVLGQMVRVLREDRRFARYCVAQSLTGISNHMTIAVAVAIVTQRLDPGNEWGFWMSTALVTALPHLAMLGSIGRWGRMFDAVGVLRFRVINVCCWGAGVLFGLGGALVLEGADRLGAASFPLAVLLFAFRGVANGLGQGGGALAWNLGHLDFTEDDRAEIYMGIHVSLTGLRGLIAPFVGMWLWREIDWLVWLIALGFSAASWGTFVSLARYERAH
jgi:hypothetical protein